MESGTTVNRTQVVLTGRSRCWVWTDFACASTQVSVHVTVNVARSEARRRCRQRAAVLLVPTSLHVLKRLLKPKLLRPPLLKPENALEAEGD